MKSLLLLCMILFVGSYASQEQCSYYLKPRIDKLPLIVDAKGIRLENTFGFWVVNDAVTDLTINPAWSMASVTFFKKGKAVASWSTIRSCSGLCDYTRKFIIQRELKMDDEFNSSFSIEWCSRSEGTDISRWSDTSCTTAKCYEEQARVLIMASTQCVGKIEAEPDSAYFQMNYKVVTKDNQPCDQTGKGFGLRLHFKKK